MTNVLRSHNSIHLPDARMNRGAARHSRSDIRVRQVGAHVVRGRAGTRAHLLSEQTWRWEDYEFSWFCDSDKPDTTSFYASNECQVLHAMPHSWSCFSVCPWIHPRYAVTEIRLSRNGVIAMAERARRCGSVGDRCWLRGNGRTHVIWRHPYFDTELLSRQVTFVLLYRFSSDHVIVLLT